MKGIERIGRILRREPVDRIGLFEHFWGDTLRVWQDQGHVRANEDLATHFDFDMSVCWTFNLTVRPDFEPEVIEETDETILTRDGNGALLRRHKLHNATPEHVDFSVRDREGWAGVKPLLRPSPERIKLDVYRKAKADAARDGRFFCWGGVNVFESIHPLCGHEHMLTGMALDPDWVRDMAATYADLAIGLLEILFEREGPPDGLWFYEDMGFKGRPFMSPDMYREIIQPSHQRTIAFAHQRGLPVIMHSCGFIEPLLPGMIAAGVDCLQVMEVKAGMDPLRIKDLYGDRLALCGGMDARLLQKNDLDGIRRELAAKIPALMHGSGYILHSDHSIPTTTDYATYRRFVDEGLRLGTYPH